MQLDIEWRRSGGNRTAQLLYPNRNGTVRYLALITHTGTCLLEGMGGGGGVASSMCPVRRLVWQWTFIVLLADQHRKRFCLAGASTCFSVGAPNQFVSFGTLCSMFDVLAVCAPNQFVSFGALCSMFDVLAVGAPNQFVSFGTLCSMFDVLAICAPNQFVSFGTLCSMFDVLAICAPNQFVSFGTLCSMVMC